MNNTIETNRRGMDLYDLEAEREANAIKLARKLAPTIKIKGGKISLVAPRYSSIIGLACCNKPP